MQVEYCVTEHIMVWMYTRKTRWLNLVNETNLVYNLFLVYFANFIYNLYIFRTSPGPSTGGTTVFMRHCLVCRMKFHLAYQTVSYTE
jgi:hypothetical protein